MNKAIRHHTAQQGSAGLEAAIYFGQNRIQMIHMLQRAIGKNVVETIARFRHLMCLSDMNLAVHAALPAQLCYFMLHIHSNYFCRMWPDQAEIAPVTTAQVKSAAIELEFLISRVFPSAPVAEGWDVRVERADGVVALKHGFH